MCLKVQPVNSGEYVNQITGWVVLKAHVRPVVPLNDIDIGVMRLLHDLAVSLALRIVIKDDRSE